MNNLYDYKIDSSEDFNFEIKEKRNNNITLVEIQAKSNKEKSNLKLQLFWFVPNIGIHNEWNANIGYSRGVKPDWGCKNLSCVTYNAPIEILMDYNGNNCISIACSDAANRVDIAAGVNEETASIKCSVEIQLDYPVDSYSVTILVDTRNIPYYKVASDISKWWESIDEYKPASVPPIATLPMYSTWYSFHQDLNTDKVLQQLELAKQFGCKAVIVDDGWQTEDNSRGYAFCGDWKVAKSKIPSMEQFVRSVHDLDMKFVLWYSVPFMGKKSDMYHEFKDMLLDESSKEWGILDPRFPKVRQYLMSIYKNAVLEWDLDGFKLDFVDAFTTKDDYITPFDKRRDYESVQMAVDRLLKDILNELRAIKRDILIEFRQTYTGPLMRTYGNMLRAADCPNDSLSNRIRTLDLRILSRNTAIHSDMLMWNLQENANLAALQFTNTLFSVPQISILLNKLSEDHKKMLSFYTSFWISNKDVLLNGELKLKEPTANYSFVSSENDGVLIGVVYSGLIAYMDSLNYKKIIYINSTLNDIILVNNLLNDVNVNYNIVDCVGEKIKTGNMLILNGINKMAVPTSGMVEFIL